MIPMIHMYYAGTRHLESLESPDLIMYLSIPVHVIGHVKDRAGCALQLGIDV